MKKNKLLVFFEINSNIFSLLLYFVMFAIILFPARYGIGLFWDWDWPVFREHLSAIFTNQSQSWNNVNLGQPMLYSSSYYARYLISLTRYLPLQPETSLYLILILITSVTSYGVYLVSRQKLSFGWSWLVGSLVILNPAYFYKLMAGHFYYLISFAVFVYLIYFFNYLFKNNLKTALTAGLLLAFAGVQIQFFIFAAIFLITYYIFNYKNFKFRYVLLIILTAFLVNLPWLSNFLVGAINVSDLSGQAADVSFTGASRASLLRIAVLSFADATSIKYFYSKYMLVFFGLFSLSLSFLVVWRIRKPKIPSLFWQTLIVLVIYILLAAGFYQSYNIPVVEKLFPMLRESGHFAPIIILFMLLLLIRLWSEKKLFQIILVPYLILFGLINAVTIYNNLPTVNYALLRAHLGPYKEFIDKDPSVFRIAAYPFFGQYSFSDLNSKKVRGKLINNSGIDVFTQSSTYDSLLNYIQAQTIDQSLQYKLLDSYDITMLEDRNIKYLLDFSGFYQTNIEKYSDPEFYHNNLAMIKCDSKFINKLMNDNSGKLEEVAPNIYKLIGSKERVDIDNASLDYYQISSGKYHLSIKNLKDNATLQFLVNYHPMWQLKLAGDDLQGLVSTHNKLNPYGNEWQINAKGIMEQYNSNDFSTNSDGSINFEAEIVFAPQKKFQLAKTISLSCLFLISAIILAEKQLTQLFKRKNLKEV